LQVLPAVGGPHTKRNVVDELDVEVILGKFMSESGMVYYGQLAGRLPHGFGVARYPDSTIYAGQFVNAEREGVGEYSRQLEDHDRHIECKYMGEWRLGMRHGFAIEESKVVGFVEEVLGLVLVEYKDDELVSSVLIDEEGCKDWISQCNHVVSWAKRAAAKAQSQAEEKKLTKQSSLKLSKFIEFSLDDGFTHFSGTVDVVHGRHGPGVLEWEDGHRLAGDWHHGQFEMFGREDYPDGRSYVGQFREGRRHGKGRYTVTDGDKVSTYVGEWQEGIRHGQGIEQREKKVGEAMVVDWVGLVEYEQDNMVKLDSFNAARARSIMDELDLAVRSGARYSIHQLLFPCISRLMTAVEVGASTLTKRGINELNRR
jgi:hypothetical protein